MTSAASATETSAAPRVLLGAHHDGSPLYVGTATPRLGDRVPVRVQVPAGSGVDSVRIRVIHDAEPTFVEATADGRADGEQWFTADVEMPNPVTCYRIQLDRGPLGYSWLNGSGEHHRDIPDAHDFRLTTHDPGPHWALDAVVYQVFPDRFARSNTQHSVPDWATHADWDDTVVHEGPNTPLQLFGEDLLGVRERLDHLIDLGATALFLTPIFPARSNHRYNASTFDAVDPLLGGDQALRQLAQACHDRGLRIIGDPTTNHSGDDHPWFRTAAGDVASVERSFYYMDDAGGCTSWLGVSSLPKFDLGSAEPRERLFGVGDSVVARWLRPPFNLDGWRIDVANMTGRHGEHDHGNDVARLIRRIAVRQAHPALRPGGLRWFVQTNNALGYLRETNDERILVVAARSPWPGTILPGTLAPRGGAQTLYGDIDLTVGGGAVSVPGDGPGVGICQLD